MKAVVLIVGVLTGAMFFTSLIVTTRLTGTLNPAETVKLIGEPYEESSDFSNTVESYMLQVLEQFQLKTLFESDGVVSLKRLLNQSILKSWSSKMIKKSLEAYFFTLKNKIVFCKKQFQNMSVFCFVSTEIV